VREWESREIPLCAPDLLALRERFDAEYPWGQLGATPNSYAVALLKDAGHRITGVDLLLTVHAIKMGRIRIRGVDYRHSRKGGAK
jgi:hypothetical protein